MKITLRDLHLMGIVVAISSMFVGLTLQSQQSATPKGLASVEGHILLSDGGAPAREAEVRLRPLARYLPDDDPHQDRSGYSPTANTDFNGYYRIPSVRPGTYIVSVRMPGYNDNLGVANSILDHFTLDEQKAILATFPQVTVAGAGSMQQDVVIHRAGAISGHLTIDSGGILSKTDIIAILVSTTLFGNTEDKDRQHHPPSFTENELTDDRGFYRIAGLPPGKYRIEAQVTEHFDKPEQTGKAGLYVYAPEALQESDAKLIDVGEGEEVTGDDINIPTRLLHSIGGTVTQGGLPVEKSHIALQRQGDKDPCNCGTGTLADGSFRIDLLPSGTWTLEVSAPYRHISGKIDHPKSRKITVQLGDSDVLDVNLDLSAPFPKQ